MSIPKVGLSFEQICELAVKKGVYVVAGCHKDDVAAHPPVVTIQIQDASGVKEPISFRYPITKFNPRSNQALCHATVRKIEDMRPTKLIIEPR